MNRLRQWWHNDLSTGVKFVFLALLVNALPAIIILMTIPTKTEDFFVWTIKPVINARLIAAMYANAFILIVIGFSQTRWVRVRIIMVVITLFSIFATVLTFFYLKPFLAHPWYHLTFWLGMYLVVFISSPIVFVDQEKKHGGRLPIHVPINFVTRLLIGAYLLISLVTGLGLIFQFESVNQVWAWNLPPLVGGLIGVLFTTHAAAYVWALWDGDWLRIRPIFWQAPLTGLLFILLPLLHPADLHPDAGNALTLYYALASFVVLTSMGIILSYRGEEKKHLSHDH